MLKYSSRLLFLNSFYNVIGKILPLLVAVITMPILIHKMGLERFGILALIWTFIGYFGVFDLGVGRATTKFTAEYLARNQTSEISHVIWTSWWLLAALGVIGGVTAFLFIPILTERMLNIPTSLMTEARCAFLIMSISLPFVFLTAGTRGVLEAQQRFGLINAINIPAGMANFIAPLPIFFFTNSLVPIVVATVFVRFFVCCLFFFFSVTSLPGLSKPCWPAKGYIHTLMAFGGWLSVSNIVGPIMVNMDRFLIGSLMTMAAVAYYVTPFDLVSRLNIITYSLTSVLYPAFSALEAADRNKLEFFFTHSVKYLLIIMLPLIGGLIILAQPLLFFWLGADFAQQSSTVMQILAVGFLINSLAHIPHAALQATGRPDLTAKLHLIELPVYLICLFPLIKILGLPGVALAWTLRVTLDAAFLFWLCCRQGIVPSHILNANLRTWSLMATALCAFWLAGSFSANLLFRVFLLFAFFTIFSIACWRYLITENEKHFLWNKTPGFMQLWARK